MSCEARNSGSIEVLLVCAKNTFFLVEAANRSDPSLLTALLAGSVRCREKLLCFLFSGTIIVGLHKYVVKHKEFRHEAVYKLLKNRYLLDRSR